VGESRAGAVLACVACGSTTGAMFFKALAAMYYTNTYS
jgi:hypothetical protein